MTQFEQFIEILKQGGAEFDIRDGTIVTIGITEFVFHINGQIKEIFRDCLPEC